MHDELCMMADTSMVEIAAACAFLLYTMSNTMRVLCVLRSSSPLLLVLLFTPVCYSKEQREQTQTHTSKPLLRSSSSTASVTLKTTSMHVRSTPRPHAPAPHSRAKATAIKPEARCTRATGNEGPRVAVLASMIVLPLANCPSPQRMTHDARMATATRPQTARWRPVRRPTAQAHCTHPRAWA